MSSSIPQCQKAIVVREIGEPVVLIDDWPVPQPADHEILVKVTVTSINPHDQKTRDWGLFITGSHKGGPLPACFTHDVVGKVVALGPNVTKYAVGDRVFSQGRFTTNWNGCGSQEYATIDVKTSAKIPDNISDDEAASIPINIAAPLIGLFDNLKIPAPWTPAAKSFDYAGTSLLVLGGGTGCGKYAIQLAGLAGIGTVVVVGGNEAEIKPWGATHVIDRHGGYDVVLKQIRNIVGDDLLYAFDAINPPPQQHLGINALSNTKRGTCARLLPLAEIDKSLVSPKEAGYELSDVFGDTHDRNELGKQFWDLLPGFLVEKKIIPVKVGVIKSFTADDFNEALDKYRDGKGAAKTNIHL